MSTEKEIPRWWGIIYELPNGKHLHKHGPNTEAKARDHVAWLLSQNKEAKFDINNLRPMTLGEINELTMQIRAKYPKRKTLAEICRGNPCLALYEGWRVPGSRQKPPAKLVTSGWGNYGNW